MVRKSTILVIFCLILISTAFGEQGEGGLKGVVKDATTNEPLVGANIVLIGTNIGGATALNGSFNITNIPEGNYKIKVTFIGYATFTEEINIAENKTLTIEIALNETVILGDQIVVTASKRPEKLTEAPATIDVITSKDIENLPSFNPGELLARQKGVDYIRTGVVGTGINIRGFNSAFNAKNLQMNDNRLATLIATGLPLGAFGTIIKEDVQRVEIILGPAAALYGPNAHNGLVNTITKDPRYSQGTTIALNGGNQSVFSGRFRYAKVYSKKFALKITGEYTRGIDFNYTDSVYAGAKVYSEFDLNRKFDALKGGLSLYFTPKKGHDIIITYGGSNSNNIGVTNAGRNQIKDWKINILQARYVSKHVFAQIYHTWSNTSKTYALNQRTRNYYSFLNAGFSQQVAAKRSFKEYWFATSPTTGIALNRGAVFKDASRRWNGEIQVNETFSQLNIIAGFQWQKDIANSEQTYLLDANGPIKLNQYGGYAQLELKIKNTGWKLMAAARADDHDLYGFNFVPKAGITYTGKNGTFRVTYSKGIAAPTILNLSANIFGGLLLGNGEGFTLSNGTKIPKLEVETISTFETGYKGIIDNKLYVDVNAYYNISKHFLSPVINIANAAKGIFVVKRGNKSIQDVIPGTPAIGSPFVLTYLNFGNVNTYGIDIGLNYYMNDNVNFVFNYSYFNFSLDKTDMQNDGNRDGKVTKLDLPINSPKNKFGFGVNLNYDKFFGTIFGRWIQAYDFFSGINVAAATNRNLIVGGSPVVENARVGRTWNYGPLGDFINFDIGAGYRFNKNMTLSAQVTNLFDTREREFVGSPFITRLFSTELKFNF